MRAKQVSKEIFRFIKHLYESRELLFNLAYNDLKDQYRGSYLGLVWSVLRPLIFIAMIWFVFSVGFRSQPAGDGTPFILWLLCAYVPWFYFSDAVSKGMGAITSNSFLVKKVAFRVGILPMVKVLSSLFVHFIFVTILLVVFLLHGYRPTLYWLQLPLLILATFLLSLGLSWMTSAIRVFVKDMGDLIGVILQFGFWLTPIFWSIDIMPSKYHFIIKLNPVYFITEGYRDVMIKNIWLWEKPLLSAYFLVVTFVALTMGALVFKRLRPHFGDVL